MKVSIPVEVFCSMDKIVQHYIATEANDFLSLDPNDPRKEQHVYHDLFLLDCWIKDTIEKMKDL